MTLGGLVGVALNLSGLVAEPALTPFGAEQAASADGVIPAWTGGIQNPPAGYTGDGHPHVDPYAEDAAVVIIDAANASEHANWLSPGMQALLSTYPETFRIPVYPTRRSHSAPDWVAANSQANIASAYRVNDGNGFSGARPGIPFPHPESALEVYWNHVARWRGQQIEGAAIDANVYASGQYTLTRRETRVRFDFYADPGSEVMGERLFSLLSRITSPARQAGSAVLVLEPIDQNRQSRSAWAWDQGRRRVLRAPELAFDMAVNAADGLHTADDTDLINGSPERFQWTLLGKRELIVPYNCYRLEGVAPDDELLRPGHLNPAVLRYERHRVWVIEGRVRPEYRHVYSRRVIYIDEDSWMALMAENHDAQGDLWRVNLAYPINDYSLPGTLPVAYAYHDLPSGRYHIKGLRSGRDGPPRTQSEPFRDADFTPQGLRRFAR